MVRPGWYNYLMRKILIVSAIAVTVIILYLVKKPQTHLPPRNPEIPTSGRTDQALTPTEAKEVDYTASFEIITNGLKRDFSNSMYHELDQNVFITSDDPSKVHVKKSGITWDYFFTTLPMRLTSQCLITGTNQQFCSGENGTLRFYLNGKENPNALLEVIKEKDVLRVTYGP